MYHAICSCATHELCMYTEWITGVQRKLTIESKRCRRLHQGEVLSNIIYIYISIYIYIYIYISIYIYIYIYVRACVWGGGVVCVCLIHLLGKDHI